MTVMSSRRLAMVAVLALTATVAGTAITSADPPGYLFMDIDNDHALVVQPPKDQTVARIFKAPTNVADDVASAIAAGAQPVGNSVIVAYRGKLYIVPDKKIEVRGTHWATHMVMKAAGAPDHGD